MSTHTEVMRRLDRLANEHGLEGLLLMRVPNYPIIVNQLSLHCFRHGHAWDARDGAFLRRQLASVQDFNCLNIIGV